MGTSDAGRQLARRDQYQMIQQANMEEKEAPGFVAVLCHALNVNRSTYYRHMHGPVYGCKQQRQQPRELTKAQAVAVLDALHEPRFVDLVPAQVHTRLLDESVYLCSIRTMYRLLSRNNEVHERRRQLCHPPYAAPELLATRPNQLWSWDITKLKGPAAWSYFYLYIIIDVFSRHIVGWMVTTRESAVLAEQLISETCGNQNIDKGTLTIHADRGSAMKSKLVAELLADLGVTKTHSRPHVSNDNPYSESHFKTLKYRPDFPERFGSLQDARAHCVDFVHWYSHEHYHSGIAYHTPADVHYGRANALNASRADILEAAYAAHPERFVHGKPMPHQLPAAVWINKPKPIIIADTVVIGTGGPDALGSLI
jgi:putative transposase